MYGKKGVTLVEVMVAIIIFTIVMLGGFVFFFYGRSHISLSNHQRMALELTKEKIEICKASGYASVQDQNESSISLGGIQFSRNTSVVERTGSGGIYKEVIVATSWLERGNLDDVELSTIIAED